MSKSVTPKVYLVGYTTIDPDGMAEYLRDTDNEDFITSITKARETGLSNGEILTSFYAKLCYASLSEGKNLNVTRIRDIPDNLRGTIDQGHGSVWEHVVINFVVHNASRVYETEQVRHRVGVAYSILSGRYERKDELAVVLDPILVENNIISKVDQDRVLSVLEDYMRTCNANIDLLKADRDTKKKLTSAVRRLLPQGIAREVGMSLNLRAIRHITQVRTSRHSEWEIRSVYAQVYHLLKERFPLLFYGAKEEIVNGLVEVSGMKLQPYEK